MDTTWAFRQAYVCQLLALTSISQYWQLNRYDKARQIKVAQDDYCAKAMAGRWSELASNFPEDLQWEALVDVLRGRVKVHNHCYETVDLDDMVRVRHIVSIVVYLCSIIW